MLEWRDTKDNLPDWRDGGSAEFMRKDGTIVRASISLDMWGEEVPVPSVVMPDGSEESFFNFAKWRKL